MPVRISGELIYHILLLKIVAKLHHVFEVIQLNAVIVGISIGKLEDESTHCSLFIIRGDVQSIFRNEDVWSDSTSSIHDPSDARMIGRTSMLNAI